MATDDGSWNEADPNEPAEQESTHVDMDAPLEPGPGAGVGDAEHTHAGPLMPPPPIRPKSTEAAEPGGPLVAPSPRAEAPPAPLAPADPELDAETRVIALDEVVRAVQAVEEARLDALLLHRTKPLTRLGDRVLLDDEVRSYRIGRSEECDIRVHTPTSHRQHAELSCDTGAWTIRPVPGKRLEVDGRPTEGRVELAVGMRLGFGGDEFSVEDASHMADDGPEPMDPMIAGRQTRPILMWALIAVAAVGLAAVLWWRIA